MTYLKWSYKLATVCSLINLVAIPDRGIACRNGGIVCSKLPGLCDVIKQNESELIFIYTFYELYHPENPIRIEHTVPEMWPFYDSSDAQNNQIQRKLNAIIGSI